MPEYAELHARSNFSFLDGASHPEELAAQAAALDYRALALTDKDGFYGLPRFHAETRRLSLKALAGSELSFEGGGRLVLLAANVRGYSNLSTLLSRAHDGRPKGQALTSLELLARHAEGLVALTGEPLVGPLAGPLRSGRTPEARELLGKLKEIFGRGKLFVELSRHLLQEEDRIVRELIVLARSERVGVVATNGVRYARAEAKPLFDVLSCIRNHTTLQRAGTLLAPNAEHCLKTPEAMARLFRDIPQALQTSLALADRLEPVLEKLPYRFPGYPTAEGQTPFGLLYDLVQDGARRRYRPMTPAAARQLAHELDVIERLELAGYFLIVWDIVRFANERNILSQGRGSAANSAVCYCLGITAVDPVKLDLLFERFLSEERAGMPDIDLDIEHERREEVIQYVYERYGRDHAALLNEVITYRARSAVRDVGKALGMSLEQVDRIAKSLGRQNAEGGAKELVSGEAGAVGVDLESPELKRLVQFSRQLSDFPRHVGIHVGGMAIAEGPLIDSVPVEPATMPGRTVIQWDKDDCERMGIVKIDLLGLGMLTLLHRALDLVRSSRGVSLDLAQLPPDDPSVYDMLCEADTVGVFQVESRAQMNTLPRLRPRCFYDLVIEIALIRPGPIQGDMVHPYLRRRAGEEPVSYPHPSVEPILRRTLGVPLFQEQGMKLAITAANFTPGQADRLRRAMGFRRATIEMETIRQELEEAMQKNGIPPEGREQILKHVMAFSNYGFPESHSASFALLVYASAYIKKYYPAEFTCALLNSQPMGFYSPATIVNDARRHGVQVLPLDVTRSHWQASMENGAVRLGLESVGGLGATHRDAVEEALARRPFKSLEEFVRAARLPLAVHENLATSGALESFGLKRRDAVWAVQRLARELPGSLPLERPEEKPVSLTPMKAAEAMAAEYRAMGLSARFMPMAMLRPRLKRRGILAASDLANVRAGRRIQVAGLVIVRQHPGTAKGFVFLTLEDETGFTNLIVKPPVYSRFRRIINTAPLVLATGTIQKEKAVVNVMLDGISALPTKDEKLVFQSRDFK